MKKEIKKTTAPKVKTPRKPSEKSVANANLKIDAFVEKKGDDVPYEKWTVVALKALLTINAVEGRSKATKKADVIALLKKAGVI